MFFHHYLLSIISLLQYIMQRMQVAVYRDDFRALRLLQLLRDLPALNNI